MKNVIRFTEVHTQELVKEVNDLYAQYPKVAYKMIHGLDHYKSMSNVMELKGKTYRKTDRIWSPERGKVFAVYELVD